MSVCSFPFLIFCGILSLAVRTARGRIPRQLLLTAANLAFLASVLPTRKSAASLFFFVAVTYALLWLVRARPSGWLVSAIIALAVAAFLVLKRYSFLEGLVTGRFWLSVPEILGISYMFFKFIHMAVDESQGQLARFTAFDYFNYQLSFYTILAGPIQRYNEFHEFWDADQIPQEEPRETLGHWNRLLGGMIQVGMLAPLAWGVFSENRAEILAHPDDASPLPFLALLYAYPIYIYFNFSGYTDIVVAAARLVGWTLPENFNKPYLARNINDYWNRWHISLTQWIRDYIFITFYKKAAERFPGREKPLGYALLFVSLFLAGVWHGSTAGFAVFGAIHGLGVAGTQIYTDRLRSRLGREGFKAYQKNRLIHVIAVVGTLHFVCLALVFFSSSLGDAIAIYRAFGRALISSSTWAGPYDASRFLGLWPILLIPVILGLVWKWDAVLSRLEPITRRLEGLGGDRSRYAVVLAKSALITFVLISLWALEKEPEIAYMRF